MKVPPESRRQGTTVVPRFPWRVFWKLAERVQSSTFYETDSAKGEGKRSLDFESGNSRRELEEPLVEFTVGLWINRETMNNMPSRNENDPYALIPLSSSSETRDSREKLAVARVPFDFVVGEMLLPAGDYGIERTEIPGMLALRQLGCNCPAALVQAIGSSDGENLLFYRNENLYFLAQVLAGCN